MFILHFELDPNSEMDLNRIHHLQAILIPALLIAIPAPDLDPQKSGFMTPLAYTSYSNNINMQRLR